MTDWTAFVAVTGAVVVILLFLTRISQGYIDDDPSGTAAVPDPGAERGSRGPSPKSAGRDRPASGGQPDSGEPTPGSVDHDRPASGGELDSSGATPGSADHDRPASDGQSDPRGSIPGPGDDRQATGTDPTARESTTDPAGDRHDRNRRPERPAGPDWASDRSDPAAGSTARSPDDRVGPAASPTPSSDGADPADGPADGFRDDRDRRAAVSDDRSDPSAPAPDGRRDLSTGALLANVAVSQGLFAVILVAAAYYTAVPPDALGVGPAAAAPSPLLAGAVLGVALYVANEIGAGVADRIGIGHDERLREQLAPESIAGWILLLGVVLPVIAGFEELLFRAALVGAVPAAYDVSPWLMVGVSSVAFGAGHGAQGKAGIAVTTALGTVLGAAFVFTGSLLAVVLAHYLVNALEFLVHEALGIDWVPDADGERTP